MSYCSKAGKAPSYFKTHSFKILSFKKIRCLLSTCKDKICLLLYKLNCDAVFLILNTIGSDTGAQLGKQNVSNGTSLGIQESFILKPEAFESSSGV